jgi:hypothetical protein
MTIFTFANNINTTLAGAASPSATTITLASTANLPASIPAGEVLVITLNDVATRQNFEIVYATARTGATLTVARAQEGTSALAWLTGDYAFSPPTAGQQASFGQLAATNAWAGNNTFSQSPVVPNASAGDQAMAYGQLPGQFSSSLGTNGYKKYPDPNSPTGYFIEQWGLATVAASGTTNITLPIAFPNGAFAPTGNFQGGAVPAAAGGLGFSVVSTSQISCQCSYTGATYGVYYNVRGY